MHTKNISSSTMSPPATSSLFQPVCLCWVFLKQLICGGGTGFFCVKHFEIPEESFGPFLSSWKPFQTVFFQRSPTRLSPLILLPLIQSVLTGAWNGGSWLGCRDLPAMGAVFYLQGLVGHSESCWISQAPTFQA